MKLVSAQTLHAMIRTIVVGACLLDIWYSWKVARADYLFRQDTPDSLRRAIAMSPDVSDFYMRLAQLEEGQGKELLETALRLNPYNAQAAIELGLRYEADGDYGRAEKLLLQAFAVDHTYLPRWSLANFYLRRDNMPAFWTWARAAAEMPARDIGALFELCWRVSPDPEAIAKAILNDNPELNRQYLEFVLEKNQLHAAGAIAQRLIRTGTPEIDKILLFSVFNQLVGANDVTAANAIWHDLVREDWVVADTTVPNNPNFARDPLSASFDWKLASYPGLHSWPGPSGLETEFTGDQPEDCTIAEQTVVETPGNFVMNYSYQTTDIPPDTGIRWQIVDAKSGAILVSSPSLSSDTLAHTAMEFSVAPDSSFLRLRLGYHRTPGTSRVSGRLVIPSVRIQTSTKK